MHRSREYTIFLRPPKSLQYCWGSYFFETAHLSDKWFSLAPWALHSNISYLFSYPPGYVRVQRFPVFFVGLLVSFLFWTGKEDSLGRELRVVVGLCLHRYRNARTGVYVLDLSYCTVCAQILQACSRSIIVLPGRRVCLCKGKRECVCTKRRDIPSTGIEHPCILALCPPWNNECCGVKCEVYTKPEKHATRRDFTKILLVPFCSRVYPGRACILFSKSVLLNIWKSLDMNAVAGHNSITVFRIHHDLENQGLLSLASGSEEYAILFLQQKGESIWLHSACTIFCDFVHLFMHFLKGWESGAAICWNQTKSDRVRCRILNSVEWKLEAHAAHAWSNS